MTDGQTLADGRYLLGGLLGRGGMAEVHQGLDQRLGRPVAVKQLSAHLAADPTAQHRFRREAQAAASLNHPAIASVFDTGEETDGATGVSIPYIVMELVEGSTLREVLNDGGALPPARALLITQGVLDALAHSHAAGIVHRDIKPANVMITKAGAVKVMDFGIARAVDDTSASLTQTATVIGTAQYLSPEQASGQSADLRSDLYAVGCLLFELLAGRPPFVGESPISIAYQQVREAPVPPSQLNPALSPSVDAVVLKALAKDPDERYQTAGEMKADLGVLLTELDGYVAPSLSAPPAGLAAPPPLAAATSTAVRPVPLPESETDRTGRRRSPAARAFLVALSVFLLLGLGAFGVYRLLGPGATSSASVRVPDVVGSTRAEADTVLRNADLVPRFANVPGKAGKTVDTVVKQTPGKGGTLPTGSVVTLDVNVGPATAEVPGDLVGRNVKDAEKALAAAGFTSVRSEAARDAGGDAAAGTVLSVDPGEGQSVALDEDILLRYARRAGDAGAGAQPGKAPSSTAEATRSVAPTRSSAPSTRTTTTRPPRSSAPASTAPTQPTGPTATATSKPTATAPPTASSSPSKKAPPTKKPKPSKQPKPPKGG
jgi:eukaryotic-like serine/threonine-protein kinase